MRNHISNPELGINNMVALIIMAADEREKRDGRGTSKGEAETMPVEYHLSFADDASRQTVMHNAHHRQSVTSEECSGCCGLMYKDRSGPTIFRANHMCVGNVLKHWRVEY
jgi:hypothetical protein